MKKSTGILAILLALAMALSLTACGQTGKAGADANNAGTGGADANEAGGAETDGADGGKQEDGGSGYPALDLPDVSGLALTEETFTGVKFSYPVEKWTAGDTDPVTLYLSDTLETGTIVSANVRYEAEMEAFSQDYLDEITEALEGQMSFMTANAAELRSFGQIPLMYIDMEVEDKEAYVDFIIENAGLTEEDVESVGGRDGILEVMPATSQMMIYAIRDGHLFSLTGTYYDEAQRGELLELVAAVLSTVEKV